MHSKFEDYKKMKFRELSHEEEEKLRFIVFGKTTAQMAGDFIRRFWKALFKKRH